MVPAIKYPFKPSGEVGGCILFDLFSLREMKESGYSMVLRYRRKVATPWYSVIEGNRRPIFSVPFFLLWYIIILCVLKLSIGCLPTQY